LQPLVLYLRPSETVFNSFAHHHYWVLGPDTQCAVDANAPECRTAAQHLQL
jgi:hypothetical protein